MRKKSNLQWGLLIVLVKVNVSCVAHLKKMCAMRFAQHLPGRVLFSLLRRVCLQKHWTSCNVNFFGVMYVSRCRCWRGRGARDKGHAMVNHITETSRPLRWDSVNNLLWMRHGDEESRWYQRTRVTAHASEKLICCHRVKVTVWHLSSCCANKLRHINLITGCCCTFPPDVISESHWRCPSSFVSACFSPSSAYVMKRSLIRVTCALTKRWSTLGALWRQGGKGP